MVQTKQIISQLEFLETYSKGYAGIIKTISTKNNWLNNAKKTIYLDAAFNHTDSDYKSHISYHKSSTSQIRVLLLQLKANLPNQIRLFKDLKYAISETLVLINTEEEAAMHYTDKITLKLLDEAKTKLTESLTEIDGIINILEAEKQVIDNGNYEQPDKTLRELYPLIREEKKYYKNIAKKNIARSIIDYGIYVKEEINSISRFKREDMKLILEMSGKVFGIMMLIAILVLIIPLMFGLTLTDYSLMKLTANSKGMFALCGFTVGISTIMQGILTKSEINIEKNTNIYQLTETLNRTQKVMKNIFDKFMELTQGWDNLKMIPDPDPQDRLI